MGLISEKQQQQKKPGQQAAIILEFILHLILKWSDMFFFLSVCTINPIKVNGSYGQGSISKS